MIKLFGIKKRLPIELILSHFLLAIELTGGELHIHAYTWIIPNAAIFSFESTNHRIQILSIAQMPKNLFLFVFG